MDPTKTLEEIRKLAERALAPSSDQDDTESLAEELAEKVEELDHWLTVGGFLPKPWRK